MWFVGDIPTLQIGTDNILQPLHGWDSFGDATLPDFFEVHILKITIFMLIDSVYKSETSHRLIQ